MVTKLYLIRHCEALGNINDTFQGSIDEDITEKGQRQLDNLAERCKDIPFDVIYSSPLIRALKTAQAANRHHGLEIITDPAFTEINGGEFEGVKWDELPVLFPDTYFKWRNDFAKFATEKGESMTDVYRRVSLGAMKAVRENKGRTVLIVSHGCAIRNLCCYLRGLPLEEIGGCEWVDNTGICRYDFDEDLNPAEIFVNDCAHIMNDPSTAPHQLFWRNKNSR